MQACCKRELMVFEQKSKMVHAVRSFVRSFIENVFVRFFEVLKWKQVNVTHICLHDHKYTQQCAEQFLALLSCAIKIITTDARTHTPRIQYIGLRWLLSLYAHGIQTACTHISRFCKH